MGLLADRKRKRQEKFSREFISIYDSVLYLGEPLNEALEYIIDCIPYQSKLCLTNEYLQPVFIGSDTDLYGDDDYWVYGIGQDNQEIYFKEIAKILTECINKKFIDTQNPIYNLGFGKKRFLEYLQNDGVAIDLKELETAQSPTPFFDENVDIDYYTFQSIIDERDELREKIENLSNDYPVNIELQAENHRLKAEIERLTTELNKKPTTPAKEQQGDSLLILGAVMDCLDNEIIRHYSQSVLIGKIREKYPNTTGLSESTISKKISESKRYLQQHK